MWWENSGEYDMICSKLVHITYIWHKQIHRHKLIHINKHIHIQIHIYIFICIYTHTYTYTNTYTYTYTNTYRTCIHIIFIRATWGFSTWTSNWKWRHFPAALWPFEPDFIKNNTAKGDQHKTWFIALFIASLGWFSRRIISQHDKSGELSQLAKPDPNFIEIFVAISVQQFQRVWDSASTEWYYGHCFFVFQVLAGSQYLCATEVGNPFGPRFHAGQDGKLCVRCHLCQWSKPGKAPLTVVVMMWGPCRRPMETGWIVAETIRMSTEDEHFKQNCYGKDQGFRGTEWTMSSTNPW